MNKSYYFANAFPHRFFHRFPFKVLRNQGKLRVETLQGLSDHVAGLDYSQVQHSDAESIREPEIMNALRRGAQHQLADVCETVRNREAHGPVADRIPCPETVPATPNISNISLRRKVGRRILLPATFGGSPRDLHQCYLDAMAIVAKFGRPDFFITITANPNWDEVQKNLRCGETAADRPDLVSRVFRAKLRELIQDLTVKGVLGKAIAYTYVVEFQKRGLPHAHLLLILRDCDKPRTAADVDRLVSAEVPDKNADPRLHHLVETFMVHSPCGALDPTCPCMTELGKCSKHFPKQPRDDTEINVGGYPAYRRRLRFPPIGEPSAENAQWTTRSVRKGEQDSTWVVPYNAYLLTKFECHLNVDWVLDSEPGKISKRAVWGGPN